MSHHDQSSAKPNPNANIETSHPAVDLPGAAEVFPVFLLPLALAVLDALASARSVGLPTAQPNAPVVFVCSTHCS